MHGYYSGERTSAIIIASLGTASVAGGIVLVTRPEDFARGFAWPLIALGGLEAIGAFVYAFQVGAEIRHYDDSYAKDRAAFRQEETTHMKGTRSRFVFYLLTEAVLLATGVGIAIGGFAANQDVLKGVGLGIASIAAPFVIIDSINNARAGAYADHLEHFNPNVSFGPHTIQFTIGGTFR